MAVRRFLFFSERKRTAVQNPAISGEEPLNDEEEEVYNDQHESDDCQPENKAEE